MFFVTKVNGLYLKIIKENRMVLLVNSCKNQIISIKCLKQKYFDWVKVVCGVSSMKKIHPPQITNTIV